MGVISVKKKKATILDEKKLRLLKFQQQKNPIYVNFLWEEVN